MRHCNQDPVPLAETVQKFGWRGPNLENRLVVCQNERGPQRTLALLLVVSVRKDNWDKGVGTRSGSREVDCPVPAAHCARANNHWYFPEGMACRTVNMRVVQAKAL